jgi:hypothetical protein
LLLSFFRLSDFERRSSGDLGCQGAPVSLALFFSGASESFTPVPSDVNSLLVIFLSGTDIRQPAGPLR